MENLNKQKQNIKWLFFDIGGVLIDNSQYTEWRKKTVLDLLKKYKYKITEKDFKPIFCKASSMKGNLDENIFEVAFQSKKKAKQAKQEMNQRRENEINYLKISKTNPSALEAVKKLSEKYKLGIMANQPISIRDKLKKAGILKFFSSFLVSDDFKIYKPDIRLFKKIFAESKADPETSVMIDDNIERGLAPAKKLGMTTVWLNISNEKDISENIVDIEIKNLEDLLKIFKT